MPILCYTRQTEYMSYSREGVVLCLLLHASSEAERGVYRRVGIAEAKIGGGDELDVEMVKQQFEAYRMPLEPRLFQEEDFAGNYIVTVV
jgi:hypothetical protein